MATYRTSEGRPVRHCHVKSDPVDPCRSREWSLAEQEQRRSELAVLFPNYHEVLAPSCKYNCHGYAFAGAHGWFNNPHRFIEDDFTQAPMTHPSKGDVLVYQDDTGEFTHSGFVEEIANGQITILRSKMGRSSTVLHDPLDVDESYGQPTLLLRKNVNLDTLNEPLPQ